MIKNSPSPAFQLPYIRLKELFIPEIIKELSQNSRPTPVTLNKGVNSQPNKQQLLANASAAKQGIIDNSGRKPIPKFPNVVPIGKSFNMTDGEESTQPAKKSIPTPVKKAPAKTAYDNKGKSLAEVKQMQLKLGVDVDGKWGAKTQAAYEKYIADSRDKSLKDNIDNREITRRPFITPKPTAQLATKWVPGDYLKKGGKAPEKKDWIKNAVNPDHKGYCTPMTKETCTPKRKAFAETMKKHHGFHKAEGGSLTAKADSTKYFSNKLKSNIEEHYNAKNSSDKNEAAKKVTQTKANLARQANKGKLGFDSNGFPAKKQNGGEMPKGGDQAAVYKKGSAVKKDVKIPTKKSKIDPSKWKK